MSLKRVCDPRQLLGSPGVVPAVTDDPRPPAWNFPLDKTNDRDPERWAVLFHARVRRRKGNRQPLRAAESLSGQLNSAMRNILACHATQLYDVFRVGHLA